jgi:hypothetical protein
MSQSARESSVSLEHLDDHLKAILKMKIREFVHLSPWFRHIPSIDATSYPAAATSSHSICEQEENCPNRIHHQFRRRSVRAAII